MCILYFTCNAMMFDIYILYHILRCDQKGPVMLFLCNLIIIFPSYVVLNLTQTTATTLPIVIPLNRCYDTQWSPPGYPMLDTNYLGAPFNDRSFVDGEYNINGEYVIVEDKRDGYYTFEIGPDGKITGFVRTNDDTGSIVEVFNEVEFIAISEEVLLFNGDPTTGVLGGGYGTIIKGSNISAGPTNGSYETTSVEDSSNNISPEEWLLKNFHKDLSGSNYLFSCWNQFFVIAVSTTFLLHSFF